MLNSSIITCSTGKHYANIPFQIHPGSRGTSWGGIPFPGVYTSYDYGASVRYLK